MSTDRAPDELSATEKARYAAARAASSDLRAAFESGDPEERTAAGEQFMQALSQLSPDETRDKLHVPDDAGEHRDALIRIMLRIPDNWGRWISCDAGWYPLIVELDERLTELDPGYELHQCKEKFGGLRYYANASQELPSEQRAVFQDLISEAEKRSERTCELCGGPGALHARSSGWLKTVCAECAVAEGYSRST